MTVIDLLRRLVKVWDNQDLAKPYETLAEINQLIREVRDLLDDDEPPRPCVAQTAAPLAAP